jgi:hypothetical protein
MIYAACEWTSNLCVVAQRQHEARLVHALLPDFALLMLPNQSAYSLLYPVLLHNHPPPPQPCARHQGPTGRSNQTDVLHDRVGRLMNPAIQTMEHCASTRSSVARERTHHCGPHKARTSKAVRVLGARRQRALYWTRSTTYTPALM